MSLAKEKLDALIELARSLGATAAVIVPAGALIVEDRFAALCAEPHRCPGYGLAPGCPPHAMQPDVFRELLHSYQQILVFKIDASVMALMGSERLEIARNIHRIAANVEREAIHLGMPLARGLATGSCKELFCQQQDVCAVLEKQVTCLHAELARPSLSALGVNFTLLMETIGWNFRKIDAQAVSTGTPEMGLMAGMVLLL
jgi:predicted metal-binding protein